MQRAGGVPLLGCAARGGQAGYGMVELDNVNFHECVQLEKFEQQKMLVLEPPHGAHAARGAAHTHAERTHT